MEWNVSSSNRDINPKDHVRSRLCFDEVSNPLSLPFSKLSSSSQLICSSDHVHEIVSLGSNVCRKLTDFVFIYDDVSYCARNSASSLTNETVVRLARACPNLKRLQLQHACSLTDESLLAFFEYCSSLSSLEVTGDHARPTFSGSALDALRNLILPDIKDTKFMKPMCAL